MIRTLATELGLTVRCTILSGLGLVVFAAAVCFGVEQLYGAAVMLAFVAGTQRDAEIRCDDCGTSLEVQSGDGV